MVEKTPSGSFSAGPRHFIAKFSPSVPPFECSNFPVLARVSAYACASLHISSFSFIVEASWISLNLLCASSASTSKLALSEVGINS